MIYAHFFVQIQLTHTCLLQKQFTHTFLSHKRFTRFFVAKKIFALHLESFCALKVAIGKVQTFWASEWQWGGDDDDDEKQETKNWNLLMLRAVCASAKINADRQSWAVPIPPPGYFKHQIWTQLAILHTKGSFKRMKLILKGIFPSLSTKSSLACWNTAKVQNCPGITILTLLLVMILLMVLVWSGWRFWSGS